jgi:pyruvate/2-oxoglutarate dehydrogenase complex dihydrolipoamide dehydrogenase (E3) component
MLVGVKGEKIEASRMTVSDPMGKREVIEADTFIIATGATPRQEEWSYLKHIFKSLYFVGDTAGPRGIMEAIAEGNWAGRMI